MKDFLIGLAVLLGLPILIPVCVIILILYGICDIGKIVREEVSNDQQ